MKCVIKHGVQTEIESLPARGAWIEIMMLLMVSMAFFVAPRTGSVD